MISKCLPLIAGVFFKAGGNQLQFPRRFEQYILSALIHARLWFAQRAWDETESTQARSPHCCLMEWEVMSSTLAGPPLASETAQLRARLFPDACDLFYRDNRQVRRVF